MKIQDKITNFVKNLSVNYYLEEFKKVEQKQFSWNWSAFLFGPAWFAYRKMPKYCLVSIIIVIAIILGFYYPFILRVHCKDFLTSPMLYEFLAILLVYMIIHGILGNPLYYNHLQNNKQIEISLPVAPIFGSLCLFYYIDCFQGALWLRHYHMTHNYCSSTLTEAWALLGEISSWVFMTCIVKAFYSGYIWMVNHKTDLVPFNSKSLEKIISKIKSSIGLCILCGLLFVLTKFTTLLGVAIIVYAAYKFVITQDVELVDFNSENASKILSIKSTIIWWFIPAILNLGLYYSSISEYIKYLEIFLQKI